MKEWLIDTLIEILRNISPMLASFLAANRKKEPSISNKRFVSPNESVSSLVNL